MIIDGHAHACGSCLEVELVLEYLRQEGIDKVILSAGEHGSSKNYGLPNLAKVFQSSKLIYLNNRLTRKIIEKTGILKFLDEENLRLAQMAEDCPDQIMNTYWVNANDKNPSEKLEEFAKYHDFKMIKLHQCWTPFDIREKWCEKIFNWAAEFKKPVFIHFFSKEQIRAFIKVAEQHPRTDFIVAHLVGIEEFDQSIAGKNIYFDLSCPELHSIKMLRQAYDLVGADRLILGSDTPYGKHNIKKVMKQIESLRLTQKEKELIYSGNLIRLLDIK